MANLIYCITPSLRGQKKGKFGISVGYKGSTIRIPYLIEGLKSPNVDYWNKKEQRFLGGTQNDVDNNKLLDDLRDRCDKLLKNPQITTPQQFVEALRTGKDKITFGDYIESLIKGMKNGTDNKKPSRNYQNYVNLFHKLEKEGNIINVSISDINNKHFIAFSDFILSLSDDEGRSNYLKIMGYFKAVWKRAFNKEINNNLLRFKYDDYAPSKDVSEKLPSLSLEQYKQFVNLDLSKVYQSGIKPDFYKKLYHNFCIFLYETKSRPVDVLRLHSSQIETINGKPCIKYVAEKKKNTKDVGYIFSPLSPKALEIINYYKGMSKGGYVFPFACNDYEWDYKNADSWNKWNIRKNRALEMIRIWLKKVAKIIGVEFDFTLYTFRRSAFSHACNADNVNWGRVALCGGTSIDMLEKHYVSLSII